MNLIETFKKWFCHEIGESLNRIEELNKEKLKLESESEEILKRAEDLEKIIIKLEKSIPESNPKEKELNDKYPKKTIVYKGRSIPNFGTYDLDVRNFFVNPNSSELQKIAGKWKDLPDDEKALECQKWVKKYIKYVSDKTQFDLNEYWEYPSETLKTKKGDCDDQAILNANLMLSAGIPYWKIRIACATVYDSKGNEMGGHAFVCYYIEEKDYWVAHDTTFYPDLRPVKERPDYKDSILYGKGEIWFSWNKLFCFSKSG